MTDKDRIDLAHKFEKPGHKSKKFLAFVMMELLLGFLAVYALDKQPELGWPLAMFMFGIVMTMGAIALVFNGYQAKLDMYIRGMAMVGKGANGTTNAVNSNATAGHIVMPLRGNATAEHVDLQEDTL